MAIVRFKMSTFLGCEIAYRKPQHTFGISGEILELEWIKRRVNSVFAMGRAQRGAMLGMGWVILDGLS